MYHPTILFITAVRTVQLAITSYIGWNKALIVKLYKHKHEILRFFLLFALLFITHLFSMGTQ